MFLERFCHQRKSAEATAKRHGAVVAGKILPSVDVPIIGPFGGTQRRGGRDSPGDLGDGDMSWRPTSCHGVPPPKPGENLEKHLENLRSKMFDLAENLDFEEAANIRDEIKRLEKADLEIGLNPFVRQSHLENASETERSKQVLLKASRSKAGAAGTKIVRGKVVRK